MTSSSTLHSSSSTLSEKLITKLLAFLNDEFADNEVVERLRETLDELWDEKSNGIDRFDIPVFLRRAAD